MSGMQANELPIELRDIPQWVCWTVRRRDGKQTKIPLDPNTGGYASTADPSTWGTFHVALMYAMRDDVAGIGFVFDGSDPYVGIDLDDCRDGSAGNLIEEAQEIIGRIHSYTEVSPSGTGVHIIAAGELPDGPRRRGFVEMYDDGRFFTMTGDRVAETPARVCDRAAEIRAVHREHLVDTSEPTATYSPVSDSPERTLTFEPRLTDDEILEKARSAANGAKFSTLWYGDLAGYDSQSEADMALCCLLAFWAEGHTGRIDQLFRQSGLMRPKWDEVHFTDGRTYGERTIERACEQVSRYYGDRD